MFLNLRRSLALVCTLTVAAVPAAHADIAWTRNYSTGISQAKRANKPIVIDFYADWCPPCQEMERSSWPNRQVQALSSRFVMIKLNVDVAQREAAAYAIESIPTTVFLNSRGQYLGKVVGGQGPDQLAVALRQALTYHEKTTARRPAVKPTRKPVRVVQGGQVTQVPTNASNWQSLPGMARVSAQPGYSGAYLLDENGAVPLDSPAKPKPKAKPVNKTGKTKKAS